LLWVSVSETTEAEAVVLSAGQVSAVPPAPSALL